jgi:amino acid transporter
MKLLPFRNRLVARPVSDAAPASERRSPADAAKAAPQWRETRLTPMAALGAILALITVLLCEPSGLTGWLKALAAAVIVPGGAYAIVKTAIGEWRVE